MMLKTLFLIIFVHGVLSGCPCAIEDSQPYGLLTCNPHTIHQFPEDVTTNPECNIDDDQVWGILLFNQPLTALGPFAFKDFLNLDEVDIVMCKDLSSIDVDTFNGNLGLKRLVMQDVGFNSLPYSCLDDLVELVKITVDDEDDSPGMLYVSNAWHFCDRLSNSLNIRGKWETQKYLMTSMSSEKYCIFRRSQSHRPDIGKYCTKSDALNATKTLLSCKVTPDELQNIVCELEIENFDFITFEFPTMMRNDVESFFEAESNDFFQEFNYPEYNDTYAQIMRKQKLLGAKLDVSDIVDHTSEKTESVSVQTDTLYISNEILNPINFDFTITSRVASIDHPIPMLFTKSQFFESMTNTEATENSKISTEPWGFREEHVRVNEYVTMRNRKYGRISVLDTLPEDAQNEAAADLHNLPILGLECPKGVPKSLYPESCQHLCGFKSTKFINDNSNLTGASTKASSDALPCVPLQINVLEYTDDRRHWYDTSAVNLHYVAANTLVSTQKNQRLLKSMSNFKLDYYLNSSIVDNDLAFHAAQKFLAIQQKIDKPGSHVVPLYSSGQLKELSDLLSVELQLYLDDEMALQNAIFNTNGRLIDMQTSFETVEMTQELYFEMELETLKEIFTAENESWHWNFEHREEQTALINEMLSKMMEQIFEMQKQEYEIMLAEAEESVKHYQNVMQSYISEAERYAVKALVEVGAIKEDLEAIEAESLVLKDKLDYWLTQVKDYIQDQIVKAIKGVVKACFSFGLRGLGDIKEAFENIEGLASDLCSMAIDLISSCATLIEIKDIIEDIKGEDDILQLADLKNNTKDILQLAVQMKGVGLVFTDIKTTVNIYMDDLNAKTGHEIDGTAAMMVSVDKVCDRGTLLIEEASGFSDIMFQFIEKVDAIRVTMKDIYNAKKQVRQIERDIKELERQQNQYERDIEKCRDEYEAKVEELKQAYEEATAEDMKRFQEEITEKYTNFTATFDAMRNSYNDQLNNLAVSIQEKMFGLRDASMNQRSMIMPIFISSCDNLFYNAFYTCDQNEMPMMSDDFSSLIEDLNAIQLTYDFAIDHLGNEHPQQFGEGDNVDGPYAFAVTDGLLPHLHGNNTREYPVSSLRDTGTMTINIKDYDPIRKDGTKEFDEYWRVRIDMVRLIMYQKDETPVPSPGETAGGYIRVKVDYPTVFNDTDEDERSHMFVATDFHCTPTYFTSEECERNNPNKVCVVDTCHIADQFSETNYQPSMDGIFRFTILNYDELQMDLLDNIRVEFSGNRIYRAAGNK